MVKALKIIITATAEAAGARGESGWLIAIEAAAVGSRFGWGLGFGSVGCLGRQTYSRIIGFGFGSAVTAASLVGRFKVPHFVVVTGRMQAATASTVEVVAVAVSKCCIDRISCRSRK